MKKWTDEIDRFILDNKCFVHESVDKTLLLLAINERFGTHFTRYAFTTHCVDVGIQFGIHDWNTRENRQKPNFNQRPLFSEREKKGMVQVKVAEPNVWKQKNVYVWEQANGKELPKGNIVVFLDSDKRNFEPSNLYALTRGELGFVNRFYGGFSEDPEESMVRILLAKIMIAAHKREGEFGMLNTSGMNIEKAKAIYEKNKQNPEWVEARRQYGRERQRQIRSDPILRAEANRKQKEYRERNRDEYNRKAREYRRKKRDEQLCK